MSHPLRNISVTCQYTTMTMNWQVTYQNPVPGPARNGCLPPRLLRTLRIPPLLRHLLVARTRVRILLGILYSITKYYIFFILQIPQLRDIQIYYSHQ